jgi:hypothetical protein
MITLKRQEEVEIFQVELSLKVKTKQSPFIAVLILAKEQEEISAQSLQEILLTSLPVRACENLLKRLEQQGYLQKRQNDMFGYRQTYRDAFENYSLTEFGEQSAVDKSFWIGEKGVYNVYVSKSNLIQQRIIRTEKVEKAEDNRNTNIQWTPNEIRQYEKQILSINKSEVLLEDVEEKCFQLNPASCILEIQAKENEGILKLSKENQFLYQTDLDLDESVLQEELLSASNEFEYHSDNKAILTAYSKDNLSLKRKVKIAKPIFKRVPFNPVELENISHIPSDNQNAELWYWELLYKNIDKYFLDENSFTDFTIETAKPIQQFYKIKTPNRKELIEMFSEREDGFYQTAKLETIYYLTF